MRSILQEGKDCLICGSPYTESHHVFFGPNRKVSERLGLKVYLCPKHHRGDYSPHQDRELDLTLKKLAQRRYLETHTMREWMQEIGKNYLEDWDENI